MKNKLHIAIGITFLLIALIPDARSAVLIVDNSSVSPGVYTTINAAQAAATAGDTLFIQPSGVVYENATITKTLHLIGPGHTPSWTTTVPQINSINLAVGAQGSIIEGLTINTTVTIQSTVTDITIRNCRFTSSHTLINAANNTHNLVVEGNVFQNVALTGGGINLDRTSQHVLIKNNFFRIASTNEHTAIIAFPNPSLVFEHNTVLVTNQGRYCYEYTHPNMHACTGHQISNNIWIGKERNIDYWAGASTFFNNITYNDSFTYNDLPGEDNLNNVLPVFVNADAPYSWSVNQDYNLVPDNPGYTGALNGGQIGMYGGGFQFRERGQPRGIPTLDQVQLLETTVPQNGIIQVRVRARVGRE